MQRPTDAGLTAELARRLARRLEANPEFLAAAFRRYRDVQRVDDAGLAHLLGADPDDLPRIALCRRPRQDAADPGLFRRDVEAIAEDFTLDQMRLAEVVRFVDVVDAIAVASPGAVDAGFLAAAKERAAEERAAYDERDEDDQADHEDDPDAGEPR